MACRNGNQAVKIGDRTLVFLDLETTGLEADCDIVQIAALYGNKMLSRYVWPLKDIHWKASEVNKITVNRENGVMYFKGTRVEHVDQRRAMTDFVEFVQQVPGKVILVAHNGRRFDFPRLKRTMDRQQVEMPPNVVCFLDTLSAFRSLWPGLKSYKLAELVKAKLDRQPDVNAHCADSDARTLQELVAFVPPARHVILERYLVDVELENVEQQLGALAISPNRDNRK